MLKNKIRNNAGITLIALVITIIVMLILAGVTINLTLGENGIFTTAQKAAKNYTDAQNKEMADLNNFTNLINNTIGDLGNSNTGNGGGTTPKPPVTLPENTPTTPSGTLVQKPAGKTWDETKINSYADGIGNTIPVPVGFTPITTAEGQGTKLTGFVIRDISVDSEGNPTETNGNEFVWVPVEGMSYGYERVAWTREGWSNSQTIDTTTGEIKQGTSTYVYTEPLPTDERDSVNTYGGYYIGRYEAGVVNYDTENITTSNSSITDTTEKENWTGYTKEEGKELKLVVKSGQQVWNHITRNRALTESTNLYKKENGDNVNSKLCSSYAWDTALKFMESTGSTYPTNSEGGYYGQSSPTTTGNNTAHPCNIYDMGGNVYEWTTESYSNTNTPCVGRGGIYHSSASASPAGNRHINSTTIASGNLAFRVTLFM